MSAAAAAAALSPMSAALQSVSSPQVIAPEIELKRKSTGSGDSPTRIIHQIPPTFKTKLAQATYEIITKWNEDVSRYPLDLRITILFETLKPFIDLSQRQLKELKEKSEKTEKSFYLQKSFSRFLIGLTVISGVGLIVSNALNVVQCDAAQSSIAALVTACAGSAFLTIKDCLKDKKDDQDELAKKAEREHKEKELKHVTHLWDFLSTIVAVSQVNVREEQRRQRSHKECTQDIVDCAKRLRDVPEFYKKNLQTVESLVSNLITRLPEDHPVQKIVHELYEIAMKQLNPVHVQALNTSSSASAGDARARERCGKEDREKGRKEEVYEHAAATAQAQACEKQKTDEDLERQYQNKWNALEKLLPTEIDYVDFQNIRLTKKGASHSPKHTVVELVTARSVTHIDMCPPTPRAKNSLRLSPGGVNRLSSLTPQGTVPSPLATTTLFPHSPAAPSTRPSPPLPRLEIPADRLLTTLPKQGSAGAATTPEVFLRSLRPTPFTPEFFASPEVSTASTQGSSSASSVFSSPASSSGAAIVASSALAVFSLNGEGPAAPLRELPTTSAAFSNSMLSSSAAAVVSSQATESLGASIQRVVSNPLMPIVPLTSAPGTDVAITILPDSSGASNQRAVPRPARPIASLTTVPSNDGNITTQPEPPSRETSRSQSPELTISIDPALPSRSSATPSDSPHRPRTV